MADTSADLEPAISTEATMNDDSRTQQINDVIQRDPFARMMGATVEITQPGCSRATLTVTEDMVNFHGATHGGVIFALGDMAFAAASNSRGQQAVALNVGITFMKATGVGDRLVAEATEQSDAGPIALYDISIKDDRTGDLVAKSQDVVYRKKTWFVPQ
jgi:acyl-CoA thioesterase